MSNAKDQRKMHALGMVVEFSSLLSIAVGVVALWGWIFHVAILKSTFPGLVPIQPNTSICFVFLGLSVWLQKDTVDQPLRLLAKWGPRILAGTVAIVGLLSLAEAALGWDSGIDQLLFRVTSAEATGTLRPGLMSPITGIDFALLGAAVVLVNWRTRRGRWPAEFLCFAAETLAIFALLDLGLAPRAFHAHIALQTAVALCVLPLGVVCMRPQWGMVGEWTGLRLREPAVSNVLRLEAFGAPRWHWLARYGLAVVLVAMGDGAALGNGKFPS